MSDMRTTLDEGHLLDYDGLAVSCVSADRSSLVAAILEQSNTKRYCCSQAGQKLGKRLFFVTDKSRFKPQIRCVSNGSCNSLLFSTDSTGASCDEFSHDSSRLLRCGGKPGEHGGRAALARAGMASGPGPPPPTSCAGCTWTGVVSGGTPCTSYHQLPTLVNTCRKRQCNRSNPRDVALPPSYCPDLGS